MNKKDVWEAVLGEIEVVISTGNFVTWFNNTYIEHLEKEAVIISVPNGFNKAQLEIRYGKIIKEALHKYCGKIETIEFKIAAGQNRIQKPLDIRVGPREASLPHNIYETNLNPRYDFNNLIVGGHNELARAASEAVSREPGTRYNPLFIYGGVGLGKTHLLQAIGNYICQHRPDSRVKYVTSERFTSNLIDALRNRRIDAFKNAYKKIDALLIDDIQFIAGKEKTQEEFFHIFNTLYQENKQIVLCSDRPPRAISPLEERLCSRFEGGMISDVLKPDLETRVAILAEKAKISSGLKIPYEVLEYIANNVQNNVRELEGALNRFIVSCQLKGLIPSLETAESVLGEAFNRMDCPTITVEKIFKAVSTFYGTSLDELKGKSRKSDIVKPRQVAIYLLRSLGNLSYPSIGKELGNRDHTTIMHAFNKIKKALSSDPVIKQEIVSLEEQHLGISG